MKDRSYEEEMEDYENSLIWGMDWREVFKEINKEMNMDKLNILTHLSNMDERNSYNSIPEQPPLNYGIFEGIHQGKPFRIWLNSYSHLRKGDIMQSITGWDFKILSVPRRKWWHKLLQKLTFGIYKAYPNYRIKLLDNK